MKSNAGFPSKTTRLPTRSLLACLTLGIASLCSSGADTNQAPLSAREANAAKASDLYTRQTREFGSHTNFLVRPGLLADRTRRRIVIDAESIRLGVGSPAEFPLIAESSGKDYEALAVSFAKPSAVHEALIFIGLPPGQGTDPGMQRFWPKGERVKITFHYTEVTDGKPLARVVPAEQLVLDARTGKTLPEAGFVFTGSQWTSLPDSPQTGLVYSADVFSPNSIVSVYNEPGSVLDVPRRAPQHEVYSYQVPNPDRLLPAAQLIQVVVEPERNDGHARVCDLTLSVAPAEARSPAASIRYVMQEASGPAWTNTNIAGILKSLSAFMSNRRDPFVTVQPDDALSLADVRTAATLLDSLENEHGVRIEPPLSEHPYYRAFLPDEKHRERSGRPIQPWELYLRHNAGVLTGELVRLDEEWKGGDTEPVYKEHRVAVASAGALAEALQWKDAPSVMLVFAPADISYGQLRRFIAPAIRSRMILYVFLPPPPQPNAQAPRP